MGAARRPRTVLNSPTVVDVHLAHVDDVAHEALSALPAADHAEVAHLRRPEDRRVRLVGRRLLRDAVGRMLSTPPEELHLVRRCRLCHGPHGTPRIASPAGPDLDVGAVHVNLSYAGDVAGVAVRVGGPVGLDLECPDAVFDGFDDVALSPAERRDLAGVEPARRDAARLRTWARKEAVLKATGHGLSIDPHDLRLALDAPTVLAWPGPEQRPALALADLPGALVGAIAATDTGAVELRLHGPLHR